MDQCISNSNAVHEQVCCGEEGQPMLLLSPVVTRSFLVMTERIGSKIQAGCRVANLSQQINSLNYLILLLYIFSSVHYEVTTNPPQSCLCLSVASDIRIYYTIRYTI